MNRLLKNVAGQIIPLLLRDASGAGVTSQVGTANLSLSLDGGALTTSTGAFTEIGSGLYNYAPTQAETNVDTFALLIQDSAGGSWSVLEAFRTEVIGGDAVLAAVQPHYAPAKAGNAMALLPDQDVRNILGSVAGNVEGSIQGSIPSPSTLGPAAVDAILDRANGVQTGVTLRQGLRQLLAALVNVQVAFALSAHSGPTSPALKPKFPGSARQRLAAAVADLLKIVQLDQEQPELGLLAPNLATACQQLATALDAIRTSSA